MSQWDKPRHLIEKGLSQAYPAAVVEVGSTSGVLWEEAFGHLEYKEEAAKTNLGSIFDLASLTKVLSTTVICMIAADRSKLELDSLVSSWIPDWSGPNRELVAVRDLLVHSSGLPAYVPLFHSCLGRSEFKASICKIPLDYSPRSKSIYSDLGFILLGFILEEHSGSSLADQFETVRNNQGWGEIGYRLDAAWKARAAPTEFDKWRGRLLVGEVHDENAWVLNGSAGHAGLFGTARSVGKIARTILRVLEGESSLVCPETLRHFTTRTAIHKSSRALGWDMMLPTSSCGTKMSHSAFGHTGFTGTSLWIDPIAGVYVVFLTNRVCPSRVNNSIAEIRPVLHDHIMEAINQ